MDSERMHALGELFAAHFGGVPPTLLSTAPGRVNLIGEHTDYNGLPVFPMALQRNVAYLIRLRTDGRVRLVNREARYGPREFELSDSIPHAPQGDWVNYVQAAAQMLCQRYSIKVGMDAAVHGDVPLAAGLSSSSATLVGALLGLLDVNQVAVPLNELQELAAEAERYVGVAGGGMDQAISLGGRAGHALRIDFNPVRMQPVAMPAEWRFVISNTLVEAEKSGAARDAYNARTRECKQALAEFLAHPQARALPSSYYGLVHEADVPSVLALAERALNGVLLQRFRHVVSEGARVSQAQHAMQRGDALAFGRLMNDSHESLRRDYEVSCPELDELVGLARAHGALGARLTGAGLGGCSVALCRREQADTLVSALRREYYSSRPVPSIEPLLIAQASDGARVVRLQS
jgi:galactokinase